MRNLAVAGTLVLVVGIAACGGSEKAISTPVPDTTSAPATKTLGSASARIHDHDAPGHERVFGDPARHDLLQPVSGLRRNEQGITCASSVVKKYGTANLDSYYTPAAGYAYQVDPILCAQNTPTGVQVSGVTTTANKASGTVTEEGFAQPYTTRFMVVDQSGTLKIDTITCNPPVIPAKLPTPALAPPTTSPAPSSPSVASIQSALCGAASLNGGGDGDHCAVTNVKVSTVDPDWVYAGIGVYNAQNQLASDLDTLIYNLTTHQLIGPTNIGFCGVPDGPGIPLRGSALFRLACSLISG